MKYATTIATTVLLAATLSAAAPLRGDGRGRGRFGGGGKGGKGAAAGAAGSAAGSPAGAVFFINNEPTGNMVVVNTINSDGTVAFDSAVATGGNGGHGVSDPIGPDPLFSQGAVKVLGNHLFAVNAGSNTLSMFNIDLSSPNKLTLVGQPVDTGGEFPVSVAVSKAVNSVCALNGGAQNGVSCFSADPQNGLTPIPNTIRSLNVNQTTPPNGPAGTVSHAIFSEDGTKLIASVKGVPPTPGFLATWAVAPDGSLSENFTTSAPGAGGALPFSMTAIPGTNAVLNTDAAIGFSVFNFGNASANSLAANASTIEIQGQKATCWSSFSPKTKNLYLTDIGTSIVTEVNVDQNFNGTVVNQYPQGNGTASIDNDIASIGSNDFLYVLLANATTISVSSLDAPGKATSIQQANLSKAAAAKGIKLNPFNVQGMAVFVANASSNSGSGAVGSGSAGSSPQTVTVTTTVTVTASAAGADATAVETAVASAAISQSSSDAAGAAGAHPDLRQ